jgi:hypothetical protein
MTKRLLSKIARITARSLYVAVVSLICIILPATHALADDTIDYNTYCTVKFTCPFFDPNANGCNGTSTLTGNDNIEKAFNFFTSKGLAPFQAAGIIGSLRQESQLDPTAQQDKSKDPFPKDGVGFGIAQWTYTARQKPLTDFAAQKGEPVTNLDVQLDYLWQEFTRNYASTYTALKATADLTSATTVFEEGFEAAGTPNMPNRIKYAQEALDRYGAAASAGAGGSATAAASSCDSSVNCGGATGNEALLCNARKFDPFGYLWGGGHGDPEAFMNNFMAQGGFTQPFKQVVDCSGLEVVSIWMTFQQKVIFTTAGMSGMNGMLRHITVPEAQPGDFMHKEGHTEIASANGGGTTFGAHTDQAPPDEQISEAQTKSGFWTDAYVYIGPGTSRP